MFACFSERDAQMKKRNSTQAPWIRMILKIILVVLLLLAMYYLVYYLTFSNLEITYLRLKSSPTLEELNFPPVSETWDTDSIPKIIHHSAPANRKRWPPLWHICLDSFYEHFPEADGYVHKIWTDEDISAMVRQEYPDYYPYFLAYKYDIQRFDVIRYLILYKFGGIYADMDVICYRNFYEYLQPGRAAVAESNNKSEGYQNALMASPAFHPFWRYVMEDVLAYRHVELPGQKASTVFATTGPQVMVRVVGSVPSSMFQSLPSARFMPTTYTYDSSKSKDIMDSLTSIRDDPNVFTNHLMTGVWNR